MPSININSISSSASDTVNSTKNKPRGLLKSSNFDCSSVTIDDIAKMRREQAGESFGKAMASLRKAATGAITSAQNQASSIIDNASNAISSAINNVKNQAEAAYKAAQEYTNKFNEIKADIKKSLEEYDNPKISTRVQQEVMSSKSKASDIIDFKNDKQPGTASSLLYDEVMNDFYNYFNSKFFSNSLKDISWVRVLPLSGMAKSYQTMFKDVSVGYFSGMNTVYVITENCISLSKYSLLMKFLHELLHSYVQQRTSRYRKFGLLQDHSDLFKAIMKRFKQLEWVEDGWDYGDDKKKKGIASSIASLL